jgi:PKD repeat protein
MSFKKIHIWIVLFWMPFSVFSQSYNYRIDGSNPIQFIYWNKLGTLQKYSPNMSFYDAYGNKAAISRSNGSLLFYTDNTKIIDSKNSVVKNSDSLLPTLDGYSFVLQMTDSTYWLLQNFNTITGLDGNKSEINRYLHNNKLDSNLVKFFPSGLYHTEIKDTKAGLIISKKNNVLFNNSQAYNLTFIRRIKDYQYVFCLVKENIERKHRVFYIGIIDRSGLNITDSINIKINTANSEVRDRMVLLQPNIKIKQDILPYSISRNCDKIIFGISTEVIDTIVGNSVYKASSVVMQTINTSTYNFTSQIDTISHSERYNENFFPLGQKTTSYGYFSKYDTYLFSPNDSILYCTRQVLQFAKKIPVKDSINILEIGYFEFRKNWNFNKLLGDKILPSGNTTSNLSDCYLNSNGKMVIYEYDYASLNHFYSEYLNTNLPIGNTFKTTKIKGTNSGNSILSPYLCDYIRCKYSNSYKDCGAYVSIENNTDESLGLDTYSWEIALNKEHTQWFKFKGKTPPSVFYKENGFYLFKVYATSNKTKYAEWYLDSIYVNIPPKPVANFYAKDSITCRYKGVQFVNHSFAKDTIGNFYLWSFGDGNTSKEKTPAHVYSLPGTYTVTLLYKNGYCDSTLTKNQYIKVVDAPKPGFSVLYKQGCSPFTANFTDTVTLNVKQKDYFFSDSNLWQNIITHNFTHTFSKPGVYTAVQRLSGYTGCVIQTDSVVFNISKGLAKADTLHVFNSSVENNNALIYWNSLNGAVKYQLYKDGNLYKQQNDTFFKEGSPYTKDVIYTVAGIDSCGNQSSTGRIGKPMFLQGNLIGNNESSIIFFSPYQQWNGVDITYKIQKLINGIWLTVNNEKVNADYLDNQFLNKLELQSCYRIEAYESSQPLVLSHSNEICIPYIPTIFVPNAFSPNGDLINDVFDVTCFGIDKYKFTVYNRWGQEVFRGLNKEAWDGGDASEGVYLIAIEYTTNSGIKLHQRINVTLLR